MQKQTRFTTIGYTKYLKGLQKTHLLFRQGKILENLAEKSWEIAPGNTTIVPKAYFLEGQLERVTGIVFTTDSISIMRGGQSRIHKPTRAYLLKDIWMLDGAIYKGLHRFVLHHHSKLNTRMRYFPSTIVNTEITDASIYSTYDGNEYFGEWLVHDCSMYALAAAEATPISSDIFSYAHAPEYESAFEMNPIRTHTTYIKNALLFDDDWGNNNCKHEQFSANRNKLVSKFPSNTHPGVFILRGGSGVSRILLNEVELAEQLRDIYGFKIVDVTKHSAAEIIAACVGAQMIIGIEGSHLTHGLMVLEPGTSVLMLFPPNRFTATMKLTADMEHIYYGFVVGMLKGDDFYIELEEVKRTIELLPTKI